MLQQQEHFFLHVSQHILKRITFSSNGIRSLHTVLEKNLSDGQIS